MATTTLIPTDAIIELDKFLSVIANRFANATETTDLGAIHKSMETYIQFMVKLYGVSEKNLLSAWEIWAAKGGK